MQKDIRFHIGLATVILFIALIISLNIFVKPSKQITYDAALIEENLKTRDWEKIEYYFDDLERTWKKHELLLKILNTPEHIDRFEELLSQSKILIKSKNRALVEYIPALKKLSSGLIKSIPNP